MLIDFADFETVEAALEPRGLVEALRQGFRQGCEMPLRHQHSWQRDAEPDASFVIMPAWSNDGPMVVKLISIVPGNSDRGLPSVMPIVIVFDAETGRPRMVMDGVSVTQNRTAAASALASTYLSREDSSRMVMLGTGALAPYLVRAHCAVRPISHVTVWGRNLGKAEAVVAGLEGLNVELAVVENAAEAVRNADIVSCATLATEPIVRGEWVSPGTHIDLVGSFQVQMREADDRLMSLARIFVDKREACLEEAGDIVLPIRNGTISESDVVGDLFDLARGRVVGRRDSEEITVFKSVGLALEDLIAARLVAERAAERLAGTAA